jgi:hypothetical protein
MIGCPECELRGDDLEVVRLEPQYVRATYPVQLVELPNGIVDGIDGEPETELLEADRDAAEFRCEGCGFETDDPNDFTVEDDEDTESWCDHHDEYGDHSTDDCPMRRELSNEA